jgi:hypothetical protein
MNSDNQKKIVKSTHKPPFEAPPSILSKQFSTELTQCKLIKKSRLVQISSSVPPYNHFLLRFVANIQQNPFVMLYYKQYHVTNNLWNQINNLQLCMDN